MRHSLNGASLNWAHPICLCQFLGQSMLCPWSHSFAKINLCTTHIKFNSNRGLPPSYWTLTLPKPIFRICLHKLSLVLRSYLLSGQHLTIRHTPYLEGLYKIGYILFTVYGMIHNTFFAPFKKKQPPLIYGWGQYRLFFGPSVFIII